MLTMKRRGLASSKKGLSPLISAVLLIAFVITLFLLISNWVRSSIIDEATSAADEQLASGLSCMGANLKISNVQVNALGTEVKLNVDNNGDGNVAGVIIRALNAAGEVGTVTEDKDTAPLGRILSIGTTKTLDVAVVGANKIEVYPVLSTGTCRDQMKSTSNIGSF
jgi:flagellin-like protein